MCLEPRTIITSRKMKLTAQVACRECRVCRDNRLNDWIGRCVAEASVSSRTLAVTLTYAGDGPESAVLRYSDVQKLLYRLRKHGYSVRYIAAGEYGERKGRAHWHAILFFRGKSPDVPVEHRFDWSFWPHGFSYFQQPDYKGFRYVLKYALKNQSDQSAVKSFGMSKKPPLGFDYLMGMADDLAQQGLALHSPEYSFSDVLDRNGQPRKYWLQGRMREMFVERYVSRFREVHGREPIMTKFLNADCLDPDGSRRASDRTARQIVYAVERELWNERNAPREIGILPLSETGLIEAYSDGTANVIVRGVEWQVVDDKGLGAMLAETGLRPWQCNHVERWLRDLWDANPRARRRPDPFPSSAPGPFSRRPS